MPSGSSTITTPIERDPFNRNWLEAKWVMAYGPFGIGLPIRPPVKRKVFVSYHHAGDQPYYDAFAKHFCDTYDVLSDNSLDRLIDSEDVDYVTRGVEASTIAVRRGTSTDTPRSLSI